MKECLGACKGMSGVRNGSGSGTRVLKLLPEVHESKVPEETDTWRWRNKN